MFYGVCQSCRIFTHIATTIKMLQFSFTIIQQFLLHLPAIVVSEWVFGNCIYQTLRTCSFVFFGFVLYLLKSMLQFPVTAAYSTCQTKPILIAFQTQPFRRQLGKTFSAISMFGLRRYSLFQIWLWTSIPVQWLDSSQAVTVFSKC